MRKFLICLLLTLPAFGQSSTSGATLPETCSIGDIFKKTSGGSLGLYNCTSENFWHFVGRSAADNFDNAVYFRGDGTWTSVPSGSSQLHISFHSDAGANATLTNQANAEQFLANSNRNIQKVDLTSYTQARLVARIVTASASANTPRIYAQYFTSFSTVVGDYLDIGSSALNCSLFTGQTYCDTGWINLVAGAKADVFVTVLQNGGDAAADPALGMVALQFK